MDEALQIPGTRPSICSLRSLQRLRAGELCGEEESKVRAHAASCPHCGRELARLEQEEAAFRAEVPFDELRSAVEAKGRRLKRGSVAGPVSLALAAGIALIVVAAPLKALLDDRHGAGGGSNRSKGPGDSVLELFVGGAGQAPRKASDQEALAPGERVRVGYLTQGREFVLVLSVDEAGVATALYPESGTSLRVEKGPGTHLLPDSWVLTGQGRERIIALFSDQPLEVSAALLAASKEYSRAGRLERMGELPLGAEQSALTVSKPKAR
ncbi:MAG: hypothetical protein HY901_32615 [Deltaproteobacteria bacterium]|nr:hypothetical protein [Deltaproteobacteria bacterium]